MKKHLAVYYVLAGDTSQVSVFFPDINKGKAFLKWTSIDLSSKLSLTYVGNVNYYKSVHNAIPTLPVGTGNTLAIFKTNQ